MSEKKFTQGDIVKLPNMWDNELGLVYDIYPDFDDKTKYGVSIITASGRDLGGFSYEEQQRYLILVKRTGFEYPFQNVMKLSQDFKAGMFKDVFKLVGTSQ